MLVSIRSYVRILGHPHDVSMFISESINHYSRVYLRFYVPGATGKEVIIFDLYPDTGASLSHGSPPLVCYSHPYVQLPISLRSASLQRLRPTRPSECCVTRLRWVSLHSHTDVSTQSAAYEQISSDVGFKCWDGLFLPTLKGLF